MKRDCRPSFNGDFNRGFNWAETRKRPPTSVILVALLMIVCAALVTWVTAGTEMEVFYWFDSGGSPDLAGHECLMFSRRIIEVPCAAGLTPPCFGTSDPELQPCIVSTAPAGSPEEFQAVSFIPDPDEVIYGCVLALDTSMNASLCVTQITF